MSSYLVAQAVDPAVGLSERADFFAMATGCLDFATRRFHLLDMHRGRYETTEQPQIVTEEYRKWAGPNFYCVGVESLFAQSDLFKHLRQERLVPIKEIPRRSGTGTVGMSKYFRLLGLAGRYERKQIVHPRSAPWLEDFETELCGVNYVDGKPTHAHEDMVDSWAMCVELLAARLLSTSTDQAPQYISFTHG